MATNSTGSTGKQLQKLVDYFEEIVKKVPAGTARGPGSIDTLIDWIQRTYPYSNDAQQEFRVVVRTPDLAELKEPFAQFCDTIYFEGSCTNQKITTDDNYPATANAAESNPTDKMWQLEVDFEVIDPKIVDPDYIVQFEFDPVIPFFAGSVSVRHRLMQEGIDGTNLNLTVKSVSGNFSAYVTPEFQLSGTAQIPKAVATTAQFSDQSNERRHYELVLGLNEGDKYALFGTYNA